MGVSGCGKTTVGKLLSKALEIPFFDGDDFHSAQNISKMSNGQALTDDDRFDWLLAINKLAKDQLAKMGCIIACSALKQNYRDILSQGIVQQTKWVHLKGSFEQILVRLHSRTGHFMPSKLLKTQFEILETPETAIEITVDKLPEDMVEIIKNKLTTQAEFGILGLGVMGKSLARNFASKGFRLSLFNRFVAKQEEQVAEKFKAEYEELQDALAFEDLKAFVLSLQKPRKIMLMVNAGKTVDIVIDSVLPHLSEGDIIIDGGNSNYLKTKERVDYLKTKNIHFIGTGVSGGEEGALHGPSIMPGGAYAPYKLVQPYLESIAANDNNGRPCCTYIGPEGSGHFVKMVHNGIEYVEMQLLAEVYSVFQAMAMNMDEIIEVLATWRSGADSYLLQITIDILKRKEGSDRLIDKVLDKAGNKGTGNWATLSAARLGVPSTLIASALFARYVSAHKEARVRHHAVLGTNDNFNLSMAQEEVFKAYKLARYINHYQGFNLIKQASTAYEWKLNLSEIARIWTEGCIIKSTLMQTLVDHLKKTEDLLENSKYIKEIKKNLPAASKVVANCILHRIPIPCLSETVNFLNGITTANSTANLLQAQRDYFGAHTYQRNDTAAQDYYHSDWKS